MPRPMAPGVFGMARTKGAAKPIFSRSRGVAIPAAMESTSALALPSTRNSSASPFRICGLIARTTAVRGGSFLGKARCRMIAFFARALIAGDGKGSTTWMAEKRFDAIQPLIRAPPMRPAPIKRTARSPFPFAIADPQPARLARADLLLDGRETSTRCAKRSGLAGAFENGRRHGFLRPLAAPENELEGRVIVLAGFHREMQVSLSLGGTDRGIREDQNVAEHDRAVLGPEVEMAEKELSVDGHQQFGDFGAAVARHPHVEIDRDVQRLQLFPPREAKVVIAPAAGDREVDLVSPGALERPTVVLDGAFEHVERMLQGVRRLGSGKLHRRVPRMRLGKNEARSSCRQPDTRF